MKGYILTCKEEHYVIGIVQANNPSEAYSLVYNWWRSVLGLDYIEFKKCYYCRRLPQYDNLSYGYIDGREIPEHCIDEVDWSENGLINLERLKEYLYQEKLEGK